MNRCVFQTVDVGAGIFVYVRPTAPCIEIGVLFCACDFWPPNLVCLVNAVPKLKCPSKIFCCTGSGWTCSCAISANAIFLTWQLAIGLHL